MNEEDDLFVEKSEFDDDREDAEEGAQCWGVIAESLVGKRSTFYDTGIRENADVLDLVASGHGFSVWKFSAVPMIPAPRCRYCAGPLPFPEQPPCEFRDQMLGCECNGCVSAMYALKRSPGHQPEICKSVECKRALKNAQMKRYRQRQRAKPECVVGNS